MSFDTSLLRQELAPTGVLRAGINRGNGVMVKTDTSGAVSGVSVDLACAAADWLGIPVDLIVYPTAGKVFEALSRGEWDVAFMAIEPSRASEIDFTEPYVDIEGVYVVPDASTINSIESIDQPGHRCVVIEGSAYDLFLTRSLKHATIVRSPTGEVAMNTFINDKLDAIAGIRQGLVGLMQGRQGLRMLEPAFMQVRQAMGTPKGRPTGAAFLKKFVAEMKASGAVDDSLRRAGSA